MIIPVKCFTCGMLLADKYLYYCKEVRKIKLQNEMPLEEDIYLDENNIQKTPVVVDTCLLMLILNK